MTQRQYRAYLFSRPLGPWRSERKAAVQDAIDAGEAQYGDHGSKGVYWNVGCSLIDRPPPAVENDPPPVGMA
jgi:hypothetical protein